MNPFRIRQSSSWRVLLLLSFGLSLPSQGEMSVIANPNLPNIDQTTLARIYTGKVIEVGGISVTPLNLPSGQANRVHFLEQMVGYTEDKYVAYWIVRKSIGKGTSPKEIESAQELIQYIRQTPGAIGYVDSTQVPKDVKVLAVIK